MSEDVKRYLFSSAVTFVSTFLATLASVVVVMDYSIVEGGLPAVLLSGVMVAARAGVKAVAEKFLVK